MYSDDGKAKEKSFEPSSVIQFPSHTSSSSSEESVSARPCTPQLSLWTLVRRTALVLHGDLVSGPRRSVFGDREGHGNAGSAAALPCPCRTRAMILATGWAIASCVHLHTGPRYKAPHTPHVTAADSGETAVLCSSSSPSSPSPPSSSTEIRTGVDTWLTRQQEARLWFMCLPIHSEDGGGDADRRRRSMSHGGGGNGAEGEAATPGRDLGLRTAVT